MSDTWNVTVQYVDEGGLKEENVNVQAEDDIDAEHAAVEEVGCDVNLVTAVVVVKE